MPSLKMKTKSSTDCFKETLLSVCQKSTMISKNSYSCIQSSQIAELDTSIRGYPDVPPSTEVSIQDIRCDEAGDLEKFLDTITDDFQLQNQEFFFIDPTTLERMEFTPGHSQSNFETFFSPLGECIEAHNVTNVLNDAVIQDDPDMPQPRANDIDGNRNSCAYQTCTVSDFYISDMIVTGIPPDGNVMYSSSIGSNLYHDYQCNESTLLFDMAEHYVLLPFLEDAVEKSNTRDAKSDEEALKESDDSGLCLQIDQLKPYYLNSDTNFNLVSYQAECFDPHDMIKDLPDLLDASTFQPPISTKEPCKKKAITLVLDLDETLVHSTLEQGDGADFSFPVFFNMKEHTVYVKQRPFLKAFMERVAEMFDIVIFTASQSIYADQLLDILDPDGRLICRRFYRESCTFSNDIYTKDLTILGVDLAKVAIIDNSPQVFQLQVNNGIPIESWFDDPSDRALISLLPFLETLLEADDVRPIIANRFGNKE